MKYGSVVFDMDGVVLDYSGDNFKWKYNAVREALREKGIDPSDLSRSELDLFVGEGELNSFVKRCNSLGIHPRETWELVAEKTSIARVEKMKNGDFMLYPEVRDVFEKLKLEGAELGIISNAPEDAVESVVNYYNLGRYLKFFRGINGFDDLPARKPNPDHLELAKAELKRDPYIYTGDMESDILAARNAGMRSVWVKRTETEISIRPDHIVEDLEQLLDIVN